MNLIAKDPLQRRIEINNWIVLAVVFIPSSPTGGLFPVISSGVTGICYDITVSPGANLIIETGGVLSTTY